MGIYDSIYQYGGGYGNVGAVATPGLTGAGASNPLAAAQQSFAGSLSTFPSAPTGMGSNMFQGIPGITDQAGKKLPGIGGSGLGLNLDTLNLALGGVQTIGNLWQAFEANKLAKAQFNFQKEFAQKNMANQIQSYNTKLEDTGRTRAFTEGQTAEQAQQYIDQNRLPA